MNDQPFTALMEYTVQASIPDHVFEHPTMIKLSQAITDILTWPNVRPYFPILADG
jgi:hypothetical protein